jgi:hypothetical protein
MSRWWRGERTVIYLVDKGRLESFESTDLDEVAAALLQRAARRVQTTAAAALQGGDVDGAYVAAYDAYRMAAEALLACQGLRATSGEGSHMVSRTRCPLNSPRLSQHSPSRPSSGSGVPGIQRSTSILRLRPSRGRMLHGPSKRPPRRSRACGRC